MFNSIEVDKLETGETYKFTIRILRMNGWESSNTNFVSVTLLPSPPIISEFDFVEYKAPDSVILHWEHSPTINKAGYKILWNNGVGYVDDVVQLTEYGTVGEEITDITISGMKIDSIYSFAIKTIHSESQITDDSTTVQQFVFDIPSNLLFNAKGFIAQETDGKRNLFLTISSQNSDYSSQYTYFLCLKTYISKQPVVLSDLPTSKFFYIDSTSDKMTIEIDSVENPHMNFDGTLKHQVNYELFSKPLRKYRISNDSYYYPHYVYGLHEKIVFGITFECIDPPEPAIFDSVSNTWNGLYIKWTQLIDPANQNIGVKQYLYWNRGTDFELDLNNPVEVLGNISGLSIPAEPSKFYFFGIKSAIQINPNFEIINQNLNVSDIGYLPFPTVFDKNLSFKINDDLSITLKWNYIDIDGVLKFDIYQNQNGDDHPSEFGKNYSLDDFEFVTSVDNQTFKWTSAPLTAGNVYEFIVNPVQSDFGYFCPSPLIIPTNALVKPQPPTNFTISQNYDVSVEFTWEAPKNTDNFSDYALYANSGNDTEIDYLNPITIIPGNSTKATISTIPIDVPYKYLIRSRNNFGLSDGNSDWKEFTNCSSQGVTVEWNGYIYTANGKDGISIESENPEFSTAVIEYVPTRIYNLRWYNINSIYLALFYKINNQLFVVFIDEKNQIYLPTKVSNDLVLSDNDILNKDTLLKYSTSDSGFNEVMGSIEENDIHSIGIFICNDFIFFRHPVTGYLAYYKIHVNPDSMEIQVSGLGRKSPYYSESFDERYQHTPYESGKLAFVYYYYYNYITSFTEALSEGKYKEFCSKDGCLYIRLAVEGTHSFYTATGKYSSSISKQVESYNLLYYSVSENGISYIGKLLSVDNNELEKIHNWEFFPEKTEETESESIPHKVIIETDTGYDGFYTFWSDASTNKLKCAFFNSETTNRIVKFMSEQNADFQFPISDFVDVQALTEPHRLEFYNYNYNKVQFSTSQSCSTFILDNNFLFTNSAPPKWYSINNLDSYSFNFKISSSTNDSLLILLNNNVSSQISVVGDTPVTVTGVLFTPPSSFEVHTLEPLLSGKIYTLKVMGIFDVFNNPIVISRTFTGSSSSIILDPSNADILDNTRKLTPSDYSPYLLACNYNSGKIKFNQVVLPTNGWWLVNIKYDCNIQSSNKALLTVDGKTFDLTELNKPHRGGNINFDSKQTVLTVNCASNIFSLQIDWECPNPVSSDKFGTITFSPIPEILTINARNIVYPYISNEKRYHSFVSNIPLDSTYISTQDISVMNTYLRAGKSEVLSDVFDNDLYDYISYNSYQNGVVNSKFSVEVINRNIYIIEDLSNLLRTYP